MNSENRRQQYVNLMPLSLRGLVTDLDAMGFFKAPASILYHGSYSGGLFDHSFAVTSALVSLTERLGLKWSRPESPYIVGMFHDLCKTQSYEHDPDSDEWFHRKDPMMPDHGALSIILAQRMISLTDEEIACIRWHMGAFGLNMNYYEDERCYDTARQEYPLCCIVQCADSMAAAILEVTSEDRDQL